MGAISWTDEDTDRYLAGLREQLAKADDALQRENYGIAKPIVTRCHHAVCELQRLRRGEIVGVWLEGADAWVNRR